MSSEYQGQYSDDGFWAKLGRQAATAGKAVVEPALKMYYAMLDEETPVWAKTTIGGALGYFVVPIDAVPDVLPAVGYGDDLAILTAALATVAAHIKPEHARRAQETLRGWFS